MVSPDDGDQLRTRLRIQSSLAWYKLAEAEGPIWLDTQLVAKIPVSLADQGFGTESKTALNRRRQWLVAQGLGQLDSTGTFEAKPKLLEALHQREQVHAAIALSRELGHSHYAPLEGEQISGTFSKSVTVASGKYAVVQKAQEFKRRRQPAFHAVH
jgi:hypothetical protein